MSNIEENVEKYLKVRDIRKRIKDEAEEKMKKCDEVMQRLENALNQSMTELGADSVKTPHGTAYFSSRYRASGEDWLAIERFCLEHNRLDFFERRISSTVVKEYAETTGELPPGVRAEITRTVNIRKS
jgi:ATP-dependent Lon protease